MPKYMRESKFKDFLKFDSWYLATCLAEVKISLLWLLVVREFCSWFKELFLGFAKYLLCHCQGSGIPSLLLLCVSLWEMVNLLSIQCIC